jgi:integrase
MTKGTRPDIHDYDRQLKGVLERIGANQKVSEKNRKTILRFYRRLLAEGLSKPRVIYYLNRLQKIATWIGKDLEKAKKADIERIMRRINRMDYTEWTKKDYRVALKKFYKWLRGAEESGVYPPEVRWINTHVSIDKQELPTNLPDEDDLRQMLAAADHPRDKALIGTLYESGCRIGELASLRIGDIQFDQYGCQLVVSGKTGSRRVRLVFSAPILASWLNIHPDKGDPGAPLWVVIGNTKRMSRHRSGKKGTYRREWSYALKYGAIASMIKRLAKKAGIRKKVNPHAWRHARATFLANKLTEQQLKHLFGWTQSSRMAATYVHLILVRPGGRRVSLSVSPEWGLP